MSRLVLRGAAMVMPSSTVIWLVSACTVICAVLPARGSPPWIRCPPIMMAPRTETRLLTVNCRGQAGRLSGCGAGSPQPGAGLLGHGAGEGAVQAQRDPLPGQG